MFCTGLTETCIYVEAHYFWDGPCTSDALFPLTLRRALVTEYTYRRRKRIVCSVAEWLAFLLYQ